MQAPKFTPFQMSEMLGHHEKKNERAERYKDVPLIVAPGQEEAYLKHLDSQICERRIGKPSEVLKVGEKVKAKVLNTNDNKISLSMKALAEEMVDTEGVEDLEAYTDHTSTGTSLGSLLAGLKLD